MFKNLIKYLLVIGIMLTTITNVSAVSVNKKILTKVIRSDYYTDETGNQHRFDTILVDTNIISILDENNVAIAQVEFDTDINEIQLPLSSSSSNNSIQLLASEYVSTYDIWGAQYSFPGGQSHFKLTIYGQITNFIVASCLTTTFSLLYNPKVILVQYIRDVVVAAAAYITPLFVNNIYTVYWKRDYKLNVFCPILGKARFKLYSNSSYSTYIVGADITPLGVADWYGGTPYDFTEPAQCRDLVQQYPY